MRKIEVKLIGSWPGKTSSTLLIEVSPEDTISSIFLRLEMEKKWMGKVCMDGCFVDMDAKVYNATQIVFLQHMGGG